MTTGITHEEVVKLGLALPGVEESSSYGTHALKVKGKLLARLKEDGLSVVLRSTWEAREERLTVYPETFFLTEHYRTHPWVLMRLSHASMQQAELALAHAWQQTAPKSLRSTVLGSA